MADQFMGGILAGSQSVSLPVILRVKSDGAELTGKVATAVSIWYIRQGGQPTEITAATLGSVAAAFSAKGWYEMDSTNLKGLYRLDVPNTFCSTGAEWVTLGVKDTANSSFYFYERFALETVHNNQLNTYLSGLVVALPNGHITSAKIGADAFGSDKFAAGCFVYDDQITTFKSELSGLIVGLPNGHITSAKIGADAFGSDKFAAGCFVYDDQITTFKSELSGMAISIPNDHITSAKVAAGAFTYDDQITTFKSELSGLVAALPDGHITAAKIGADAITSAKVAAGAFVYDDQITTFKSELSGLVISIPDDHITSAKVAAGAFTYDDQITTFKSELSGLVAALPDGHITAAKIGADAITSAKVAAGAFVYDDQITTFKSELSGMAITIPNDHITSAKVAAGALTYDDQITTFKSELSGLYTRLTTLGVRDITQYTSAQGGFPGSSPALYDALVWNYGMNGFKRIQTPTTYLVHGPGNTALASAPISGDSSSVTIGIFSDV